MHANEHHTFRLGVSKANRMPDLTDQKVNWAYETSHYSRPLQGATNGYFYASTQAPGNLRSETILSKEIGYIGNFPKYGTLVDFKLFDDRLDHLISEKLQLYDFNPTNNNKAHLRGSEIQVTYKPSDRWQLFLAYANLHNNASTPLEQTLCSKNSGSIAFSHMINEAWQWSFAYFAQSNNSISGSFFGRQDLSFSHTKYLGTGSKLITTLSAQHLNNPTTTYFVNFNVLGDSRFNSTMQYYLTA
jgi:iron complex outermembrane receptor protein